MLTNSVRVHSPSVFLILWIRIDSIYSVLLLVCALHTAWIAEPPQLVQSYNGITARLGYLQVSPDCPSESPQSATGDSHGGGGGGIAQFPNCTFPPFQPAPSFWRLLLPPLKWLFKSFQVALTPLGVKDVGPIGGEVYFDMSTTTG